MFSLGLHHLWHAHPAQSLLFYFHQFHNVIASRPFGSDQSVRVTYLNSAGLGEDGSLCLGLLLFHQPRQKVQNRPGGNPLVPQWEVTNAQGTPTGCTACTNAKKEREYSRNPTWDPPKVS